MRFDRGQVIAGFPVKLIRDVLRALHNSHGVILEAQGLEDFGAPADSASALLDLFVSEGWLRHMAEDSRHGYRLSSSGARAATARIGSAISRPKADKLLADLVSRTQALNQDADHPIFVQRVAVFGSYLTEKEALGDLDVAVGLGRRGTIRASDAPAFATKYGIGCPSQWLAQLVLPSTHVMRLLQGRSGLIHLIDVNQLNELGCAYRNVFEPAPKSVPAFSGWIGSAARKEPPHGRTAAELISS